MKKALNLLLYTLCVTITLYLVSCSKDEGAQGPAGPAGAAGAAGAPGPAGTANVIYSPWIDTLNFLPIKDTQGTVVDTIGYLGDLSVPRLDATMLNQGEIKVYANLNTAADPYVVALPYTNFLYIDAAFFIGTIEITANFDLGFYDVPLRYILIPGGTAARSPNSVDWNNYKEVQKYLGLKD